MSNIYTITDNNSPYMITKAETLKKFKDDCIKFGGRWLGQKYHKLAISDICEIDSVKDIKITKFNFDVNKLINLIEPSLIESVNSEQKDKIIDSIKKELKTNKYTLVTINDKFHIITDYASVELNKHNYDSADIYNFNFPIYNGENIDDDFKHTGKIIPSVATTSITFNDMKPKKCRIETNTFIIPNDRSYEGFNFGDINKDRMLGPVKGIKIICDI